ncbi:MAG: hypothetical protein ABSC63_17720 [Candidatus Binataceae bacterium]|jgi:hypothetical protein
MERLDAWLAALAFPLLPLEHIPAGPRGSGGFQWAFREQTARALCIGKAVRMISGIRAALILADLGFIEECGTLLRTVSDFANEIIAVCEGYPKQEPTTAQRRFVEQYFKPIATTPDEYEAQERERWVSRDDLIAAHSRWVTETGGDANRVRKLLRFLAHSYDKFVHGAYITAMELYNGRTQTFMLRGHEAEEKRRLYKGAIASKLHEALTALFQMATVANMPALADDIGQATQALYGSSEQSSA